jgi:hypothetical protein
MIERQIVIGLITSTEFLQQIQEEWNPIFIESVTAKRMAGWCWGYFDKYKKSPGRDIEGIFFNSLKGGKFPKAIAEEIENDILPGLSDQYEREDINVEYLLETTRKHFKERRLEIFAQGIQALLLNGELDEADKIASEYKPTGGNSKTDLDLSHEIVLDRIDRAFDSNAQTLISYPFQLGEFWNDQLVRGAFVALMAPEKRGKTFWLMDMAMQAYTQKRNVCFFQAGDMTETQQLRRMCIYLAKKSDQAKYCGEHWEPIRDCAYNQINDCKRTERTCDHGIFEGKTFHEVRKDITLDDLIEAYKANGKYKICKHCDEYERHGWGAPWIRPIAQITPLTSKEAKNKIKEFFIDSKRSFKLSSHANGTLTIKQIKTQLALWERQDNFIPDVIIIDYADLLVAETKAEFRHQQNEIWKGLRNISQEYDCLVITVTQADAKSYEQDRLKLKNFSEDKRKYAHVTAMYGLNQDTGDREKKIGLMRINELVKREGEFGSTNEVIVLQNLRRGRPFLGSFK